jgi:hypothetical protein
MLGSVPDLRDTKEKRTKRVENGGWESFSPNYVRNLQKIIEKRHPIYCSIIGVEED